jgi:peptidoglycan/xylan/chitin deacetylase (PgdA/CDA1 family)
MVGDADARLSSGVEMNSHFRIRWDRVSVLVAALTVLLVLAGLAIFRGTAKGHAGSTSVDYRPALAASATPTTCPPPRSHPVRTAPRQGDSRTVALTFDDGPGPWTDDVLAVLARENVHATFFVIGRLATANEKRVKQVAAAGHAVQNHSWSHPSHNPRTGWTRREVRPQIRRTSAAITRILGHPPCYFRPPQGVAKGAENQTRAAGLSMALWSVDTLDWATHGRSAPARIRARARAGLQQSHPIVLMHDGGGDRAATVAALPGIIEDYRSHGYEFVTL